MLIPLVDLNGWLAG